LNRNDLIREASDRCGIAQKDVLVVYNALLAALADEFRREGIATLRNFGRFETRIWDAMDIQLSHGIYRRPRYVKVVFKPAKRLRDYMNKLTDEMRFLK
jgi:nucleoid DNA-binding protein